MVIPRAPTDSRTLSRSTVGTSTIRFTNAGDPSGSLRPASTFSRSWNYELDMRSDYVKGARVMLPGGIPFRYATTYSRENWLVGDASASLTSGVSGNPARRFEGSDDGYEGVLFLSGRPTVFGKVPPRDAENEAVTKALNKIADSKANVGEALGTLGQTVRLFAGKAGAVAALANAIENKQFRKWALKSYRDLIREGIPEVLARNYLEYIYGFKPLMSDMYGLHEFSKQTSSKDMLISGHASASRTDSRPDTRLSASYAEVVRRNHVGTARVKAHIHARLDPSWGGLRAWNQLGLANPAALTWELVPWSFVVDWLIPVGPVLNAMSASAGLRFVDGSISVRSSETCSYEYTMDRGGSDAIRSTTHFPMTYEGYGRKTYNSWPRPGLWVDSDPLRAGRSFAALALTIANLGGKRSDIARTGRIG